MNGMCDTAMVLAAGQGLRMRPLSLQKPKPLLPIGGRAMLDHALDKLIAAGIRRAVVNAFYLADEIETHLKSRRDIDIILSREDELLDTGGGIKNALPYFKAPFFALNADLPWMDDDQPSLQRMRCAWNPLHMDALLLLMPTQKARGFDAKGDFALEKDGRVWRKGLPPPRPYVWISAQILKPELFAKIPDRIFSNNRIWDDVETRNKLFGLEHTGVCYHVGTPEDLAQANELLVRGAGWRVK
jgi:MurNAc alpha-1-phosphate uridylyltransferase